ncbi:unnamed protein product, partial [marine sediment metagenome]
MAIKLFQKREIKEDDNINESIIKKEQKKKEVSMSDNDEINKNIAEIRGLVEKNQEKQEQDFSGLKD